MNLKYDAPVARVYNNNLEPAIRKLKKRTERVFGLLRMRRDNPSGSARRRAKARKAKVRHEKV